MRNMKAFTLIELLIVVAIIAILAAIAVPNFLEAQTRAKVSRAKADMRSMTTAIETYLVDYNTYLYCNGNSSGFRTKGRPNSRETFERLSTPIAYISSAAGFIDPFKPKGMWDRPWQATGNFPARDIPSSVYYFYTARNGNGDANARWDELEKTGEAKPLWYLLESSGPDGYRHNMLDALNLRPPTDPHLFSAIYDSTNGTVSRGSMWRCGGNPGAKKTDAAFYRMVQNQYN